MVIFYSYVSLPEGKVFLATAGAQELASHPCSIAQNPQQEPGFNRNPVGTCRFRGQSVAWSETKINGRSSGCELMEVRKRTIFLAIFCGDIPLRRPEK